MLTYVYFNPVHACTINDASYRLYYIYHQYAKTVVIDSFFLDLELIQLKPISPIEGSFVIITQQMVQVLYNQTSLCIDCVLTILPMNSTIGRFVNISQSLETDIDSFTYDELTNHEIALTVDVLDKEVPLVYAQPIGIALDDETFIEAVSVDSVLSLFIVKMSTQKMAFQHDCIHISYM